jgi:hypothetical protein
VKVHGAWTGAAWRQLVGEPYDVYTMNVKRLDR